MVDSEAVRHRKMILRYLLVLDANIGMKNVAGHIAQIVEQQHADLWYGGINE